jgi:hypothetical protein
MCGAFYAMSGARGLKLSDERAAELKLVSRTDVHESELRAAQRFVGLRRAPAGSNDGRVSERNSLKLGHKSSHVPAMK